jgi:hypothetical protein
MVGRRLPDLMPAASWEALRGPYEDSLRRRHGAMNHHCNPAAAACIPITATAEPTQT